jgi:hypothetical protein
MTILKNSDALLRRKQEHEEQAWDMIFQNYWTNLVNFEYDYNFAGNVNDKSEK